MLDTFFNKKMEPPEWVRIVSHGTAEELREFIGRNPGFDWDTRAFDSRIAFEYIVVHNAFPLTMLDVLYTLGGARFESPFDMRKIPLVSAINLGMTWVRDWLLERGVSISLYSYLTGKYRNGILNAILEHSTYVHLREIVERALRFLDREEQWRRSRNWPLKRAALMSWCVSHDRRQSAAACVAWVLSSSLRGIGSWADMAELVSRCLMETRVKDW